MPTRVCPCDKPANYLGICYDCSDKLNQASTKLYLACKDKNSSYYKIGVTNHIFRRWRELKIPNPWIRLIAVTWGDKSTEHRLHKRLKKVQYCVPGWGKAKDGLYYGDDWPSEFFRVGVQNRPASDWENDKHALGLCRAALGRPFYPIDNVYHEDLHKDLCK